ncbi:MAG TPA: HD domain-containing protein [Vicinamibacterales bacterium]|jgi:hypothetical protein
MTEPFARPSARIARALDVARIAHAGATRKGTTVPYIEHPVAVARLLEEHGYDEDLVVAGLLHDVVEDARFGDEGFQRDLCRLAGAGCLPCPAGHAAFRAACLEFLRHEFGARVFELVMAVTETKNDGGPPRDWLERKKEQLDRLAKASPDEAALKAADAVHNIECTLSEIRVLGLSVLDRFRGGPLIVWHYSTVASLVGDKMAPHDPLAGRVRRAAGALCTTVQSLRGGSHGDSPSPTHTGS